MTSAATKLQVNGPLSALQPGFVAALNTDVNVTATSWLATSFAEGWSWNTSLTGLYNDNNVYDVSTNTFTVPITGVYALKAMIYTTSATNVRPRFVVTPVGESPRYIYPTFTSNENSAFVKLPINAKVTIEVGDAPNGTILGNSTMAMTYWSAQFIA